MLSRGPKSALVLVRHVDDGFRPENTVTIFYSEDYFQIHVMTATQILGV